MYLLEVVCNVANNKPEIQTCWTSWIQVWLGAIRFLVVSKIKRGIESPTFLFNTEIEVAEHNLIKSKADMFSKMELKCEQNVWKNEG